MIIIPKKGRRRAARAMDTAPDAAIRNVGLRLTGPRRVVLEVVRATDLHPTAELVHRMVRRRLPRVSLGTVYRNLRLLVAEGLVNELPGSHASTATRATTITSRACYAGASLTWMVRSPSLIRSRSARASRPRADSASRIIGSSSTGAAPGAGGSRVTERSGSRASPPGQARRHPPLAERRSPWQGRVSRVRRATTI